jgi:hypothetical protein
MNEWQVVGVIMALVGLVSAIVAPIIKLNTSITKLTVLLDGLKSNQGSYEQRNHEAHKRIWEHNDEQDEMLHKHEADIQLLKDGRNT